MERIMTRDMILARVGSERDQLVELNRMMSTIDYAEDPNALLYARMWNNEFEARRFFILYLLEKIETMTAYDMTETEVELVFGEES